ILSSADTITDEPTARTVPTNAELGQQVKRIRTATLLSECPDTLAVDDAAKGDCYASATNTAPSISPNNAGPLPHENTGLVAAFSAALNAACQPGGALHT
ncbi:hypothetical protein HK102_007733, partial [Quaeritorhiza haematococci]